MMDWQPFVVSLQLAALTTATLLILCIPLAWWLCFGHSRSRGYVEALSNLPLVLPPTVLGFYLLLLFSVDAPLGRLLQQWFDIRLVFSFSGLVVGSVLFSLPFMLQPLLGSFRQIPSNLIDAARTMGKSEWQILQRVLLPLSKPGLLAGMVLSFAHTIGEFGVVLMVGGNIPGSTRTVSIAIYNEVDRGAFASAHWYAVILVSVAFAALLLLRRWQHREVLQ